MIKDNKIRQLIKGGDQDQEPQQPLRDDSQQYAGYQGQEEQPPWE
jgi:hypothetical protein